jgi:hypothetical protein
MRITVSINMPRLRIAAVATPAISTSPVEINIMPHVVRVLEASIALHTSLVLCTHSASPNHVSLLKNFPANSAWTSFSQAEKVSTIKPKRRRQNAQQ